MNALLGLGKLVCIIALALFASASAAHPSAPSNLRIIDNFEQLGVDVPNPRFAWFVNDKTRAAIQTAYRIVIASSESDIDKNAGDMWDTEKVISSDQCGISYGGRSLQNCRKYWWKVMTWDKNGERSPWSKESAFVTGYMNPADWTAHLIASPCNCPDSF